MTIMASFEIGSPSGGLPDDCKEFCPYGTKSCKINNSGRLLQGRALASRTFTTTGISKLKGHSMQYSAFHTDNELFYRKDTFGPCLFDMLRQIGSSRQKSRDFTKLFGDMKKGTPLNQNDENHLGDVCKELRELCGAEESSGGSRFRTSFRRKLEGKGIKCDDVQRTLPQGISCGSTLVNGKCPLIKCKQNGQSN